MNLKSRVDKLELKATSSNQTNPEPELDFAAMTDEELREIIRGEGSTTDFTEMTDEQLRAVVAGNYKMTKNGEYEFLL